MNDKKQFSDAARLETLWGGEFGDHYVNRNINAGTHRGPFWKNLLAKHPVRNVLEVGCNIGANLRWIAEELSPQDVYGVDINIKSLEVLRRDLPQVNALWSPARLLPFRDGWFDMTFTMGVLIHQPENALPLVMSEVVRCSRKYVFCAEYFAETTVEIPYHGHKGALFKRNYSQLYIDLFPELRLCEEGFLSRKDGWDDVTYWLFEKPSLSH
jgi:pseudaminic acid biosynthesis-associated methylase